MKFSVLIIALIFYSLSSLAEKITKAGDYQYSIEHDGFKRNYSVFVPKLKKNMPVVFSFHGGGGTNKIMKENYNFIETAKKENFIVVFPNGSHRRFFNFSTWNAGYCCGYSHKKNRDDVGFIKKIILDLKSKISFNKERLYATGISNGGMFSYRLACEMSDVFAAIAPVAASDTTMNCKPKRAISIFHIHALNDQNVPYKGGIGEKSRLNVNYLGAEKSILKWMKINKCLKKKLVNSNKDYSCHQYSSCKEGSEIKFCTMNSGGHSWPSGKHFRKRADAPIQFYNATSEIWSFFKNKKLLKK